MVWHVLSRLRLVNYRSFRDFTVTFPRTSILVGPNNAGKSTILTALRLVDAMLRVAHARRANGRAVHRNIGYWAQEVPLDDFPSLRESLRHEFHPNEVRIEVTWASGNRLIAVWPAPDDDGTELAGHFILLNHDGSQPASPGDARLAFPRFGVVPILSPLEHTEQLLSPEYVKRNESSRLASRHFRNQLHLLQSAGLLEDFKDSAEPWLSGMSMGELTSHPGDDGPELDLYLKEDGSRFAREVIWAGDGIQVWLQILLHLYRFREFAVIVLDEPDVYLHADLQRRLTRLLEAMQAQTVVATHSAEVIAGAPKSSVVWVEKSRRRAQVVPPSDCGVTKGWHTEHRVTTRTGRSTAVSAAWSHRRTWVRGGARWPVRPSSGPSALPLHRPRQWGFPSLHTPAAA